MNFGALLANAAFQTSSPKALGFLGGFRVQG